MPYRDIAKRRKAQRRRYWAKQGVSYPETDNSQPDQTRSSPNSSPVGEKVTGFNSSSKRKLNLLASIRPHLGEILTLIAGIGLGIGSEIATRKYQVAEGKRSRNSWLTKGRLTPDGS